MALTGTPVIETGAATNVLLLAPTMHAEVETGCGSLLSAPDAPRDALLSVLTVESPQELLHTWEAHVDGEPPESAAFLTLGSQPTPASDAFDNGDRAIHPIPNPSNLTDIGVVSSKVLAEWQDQDRAVACCFRSITTLLQYVESRTVYRFLHQFSQQIAAVGGVAHYHMDPSAHEPAVVNTMLTLFDAVVEPGDDGWQVRSRSVG